MGNLVQNPSTIVISTIVYIGICVAIFFGFIFFIRYFEDPEDKGGYFTFFITWLLYSLTTCVILLLPFDVMCRPDSQLYMPIIWQIFMLVLAGMVVVCLPFTICCYEEDGSLRNQICTGICWTGGFIFGFALITILMYLFLGYAELPIRTEIGEYLSFDNLPENLVEEYSEKALENVNDSPLPIRMTYFVYAICLLSLAGWVFFIIFGGCGVTSFPLGLITDFIYRPRKLSAKEFVDYKVKMNKRIDTVIDQVRNFRIAISTQVASPDKTDKKLDKKQKEQMQQLREEVDRICVDYDQIAYVEHADQYNVLIPILKLIVGIIGLLFVILWLVQIIVTDMVKAGYFLSEMLKVLDDNVIFLGAVIYGVMIVYMICGIINGNIRIGTRFLLVTLYPMHAHNTLPNALLFNGGLYAVAAFALIQFCAAEFQTYVATSGVNAVFTNQMMNMRGIKYIFRYLSLVLFGFMIIGIIISLTIDICCKCYRRKQYEKKHSLLPRE